MWQKTYERNTQLVGNDACQTADGNFVITGATSIASHGYAIFVMKINGLGDTLWTNTIPNAPDENDVASVITATDDGGVVIAGQNDTAWACKLDNSGNIIWHKKYLLFSRFSEDIKKTDDNGFIICGYVNDLPISAFIFKIDSMGSLIWDRTFSYQFLRVFYSIAKHDSGFILTGFESPSIGSPNKMIIFCVNNQGDSLWQKSYYFNNRSSSGRKIIKMNNDYFIGSGTVDSSKGQIAFMKIDMNGDSIFTRRFPVNGRDNYFNSFAVANNKLIFSYARDSSFGLANSYGLITDLNGNIINQKVFTNSSFVWGALRGIVPIANGDILFAGTGQLQPSARVIYAVRTDSLLNTSEYIGVEQISNNVPKSFYLFNNYPNPFNPTTTIKYEIPKDAEITIRVYDLLGREVFSINEYKKAGSYEVKFDGANLASGMYLYSLEVSDPSTGSGRGYMDTKKMVLLK